ncbi:MAG: hypothetical protein ACFFCV_21710 [Promethearchaeota archaeon]
MIKILTKKRKRFFITSVIILFIASGIVLYYFINLFNIFDVRHYQTDNDFIIDYGEEYGGVNVNFQISYQNYASFDSLLIFHTISSANVEEIGITKVSFDVYSDTTLVWLNDFNYDPPVTYEYDSFVIGGIGQYDNISCIGIIYAQFNVEGIVQNETLPFVLSIVMPVNPLEIRDVHFMNLIWIEYGLGILLLVLVLLTFRTIQIWKREATYTDDEIKKDKEFWDFINDELEKFKKESSDQKNKKKS